MQRGVSLVETMVGLAVGLLVVAAAGAVLAQQSREHRSQTTAQRLMQDLRSATDVVTRDLRRAGAWGDAAAGVWSADAPAPRPNPYAALAPAAAASDAAGFTYSRDAVENHAVDSNERFGLRLRNGVIELLLGAGGWQALTDAGTLEVTEFSIAPRVDVRPLAEHCATPCPPDSVCGPRLVQRSLALRIAARATADRSVLRSLHSEVRVRNDAVEGACPA